MKIHEEIRKIKLGKNYKIFLYYSYLSLLIWSFYSFLGHLILYYSKNYEPRDEKIKQLFNKKIFDENVSFSEKYIYIEKIKHDLEKKTLYFWYANYGWYIALFLSLFMILISSFIVNYRKAKDIKLIIDELKN